MCEFFNLLFRKCFQKLVEIGEHRLDFGLEVLRKLPRSRFGNRQLILGELKRSGYIESRRGADGGYLLAVSPRTLTVGDVIRFIEGSLDPVKCLAGNDGAACPLRGNCAFLGLWERAKEAVTRVYDDTTFQDLIEQERAANSPCTLDYSI